MIKKIWLLLLFVLVGCIPVIMGVTSTPGTAFVRRTGDTMTGTLNLQNGFNVTGGTASSTVACASGFLRKAPNLCVNDGKTQAVWTDTVACTARTTGSSLPAAAKMALLELQWLAYANNAVGQRTNHAFFWNNTTCNNFKGTTDSYFWAYEFNATLANTQLGRTSAQVLVPLVSTDTFYATQQNTGGNGNAEIDVYSVVAYWD